MILLRRQAFVKENPLKYLWMVAFPFPCWKLEWILVQSSFSEPRGNLELKPTKLGGGTYEWQKKSEVIQSCPTLCNRMDYSLPGSCIHEIFQARVLEWVAISFSGDLPHPGIKTKSPALQAESLPSDPPGKPYEWQNKHLKRELLIAKAKKCFVKMYSFYLFLFFLPFSNSFLYDHVTEIKYG